MIRLEDFDLLDDSSREHIWDTLQKRAELAQGGLVARLSELKADDLTLEAVAEAIAFIRRMLEDDEKLALLGAGITLLSNIKTSIESKGDG